MSNWSPFFLVMGAVAITLSLGRLLKKRRPPKNETSDRDGTGNRSYLPDRDERTGGVLSPNAALEETERSVERRIHTLRVLVSEADERIRILSRLTAAPVRDKVLALHEQGIPDEEIAGNLGLPLARVRKEIAGKKTGDQA